MAVETKARILEAGETLFRRQGYAGTGVKQIVAQADAPFSSLYHFFPGGKEQLAADAIGSSGLAYQRLVEAVFDQAPDALSGIHACFEGAAQALHATGYEDACPIATVALEVASTNERLREATAEVFEHWIDACSERLRAEGLSQPAARGLSLALISALEGAFVLSRAMRTTEPLIAAGRAVAAAFEAAPRQRSGRLSRSRRAPG